MDELRNLRRGNPAELRGGSAGPDGGPAAGDPRLTADDQPLIATVEEIVEEARQGRMFILVDDEDRENEGDLVIPAQMATPAAINFMAKFGRGLICLALDRPQVERLGLALVSSQHANRHATAFTVSIEAREGITTGISAADRAHTIQTAIQPSAGPHAIVTPGHVFPLAAREGGVLVRAGHTEAAVDIARMAGLIPAGVICEIMNDDGTMARMPDLIRFAQFHGLKIGTIADLIAHRRATERLVQRLLESEMDSAHGGTWRLYVYANRMTYAEHVALVMGRVTDGTPVPVRMHAASVLDDMLGDRAGGKAGELAAAMAEIARIGRGVVVLVREAQPDALSRRLRERLSSDPPAQELRDYGVGAQILVDLGVRQMILLTNHKKQIVGLDGYGLTVVERRPFPYR